MPGLFKLEEQLLSVHPPAKLQEEHAPDEHVPLHLIFLIVITTIAATAATPRIDIIIISKTCIMFHLHLNKQSAYLEYNK